MSSHPSLICCVPCMEYKRYADRIDSNGIYVTDLPYAVREGDLFELFSRYGNVADFFLADSGQYCLVHFEDRRPVDELITYPTYIYNRQLSIRPRYVSKADNDQDTTEAQFAALHEVVLKNISQKNNVEDQLQEFMKTVEADSMNLERQQQEVRKDLESVLKRVYSTYTITPFGSSLSGLALKNSDLDLYYGPGTQTHEQPKRDTFRKVRLVLEKVNFIRSFKPIPNARVPIIKFIHKNTNISCDLSFRNAMGVKNSKLIKFLISLDSRVKQFFMVVKFWAKLHRLVGKRLSNYALIMLLISFLQSLSDPILPPLAQLQHNGVVAEKIEKWNVAFDDDKSRLRPVSNNLPVEELLIRFFESVMKTDFKNYVVSPYVGTLVSKHAFHNMSRLPPELNGYAEKVYSGTPHLKVDSVLCIQDPIELNLNITKSIAKHDFQCLLHHCEVAAKLGSLVPPHVFLSKLLSRSYQYPQGDLKKSWLPNPMHVLPVKPYMTLHVPAPENLSDEILWRTELTQKVTLIFKKVLKISVESANKGSDSKPGMDQDLLCKGSQVLWVNRDKLWHQLFSNKSVQVLDLTEDDKGVIVEKGGAKRKRSEDLNEEESKRIKIDKSIVSQPENDVDLITIDSDEESIDASCNKRTSRSLEDEINLTKDIVRKGHALPALQCILDFRCSIGKGRDGARIEVTDYRSRLNYFTSMCVFLEEFLNKHIVSEGTSR